MRKNPYFTRTVTYRHRFAAVLLLLYLTVNGYQGYAASYSSSSVAQVTGNVVPGSVNQQVVVVTITGNSSGFLQDWKINSCSFTLNNTNNADVAEARLWMSSSNNFAAATQVGSTISNPTGTILFTVNSPAIGNNSRYLFLTYTISSGAPCSGGTIDALVPTNGLVIGSAGVLNGGNAGNKTPSPNDPAGNRPIFLQATPSVVITATGGGSCEGATHSFSAAPTNGGPGAAFQWKVNGINVGTNSNAYSSSSLVNGDQVQCELTSDALCASPVSVLSNTLTVSVFANPKPKLTPSDTVLCAGAIFTITAKDTGSYSGGYPAGTLFDFGLGPVLDSTYIVNGPGIYTVMVTLPVAFGGCSSTSPNANIYYADAPVAVMSADSINCFGQTDANVYVEVFLGTPPFRYKWYGNGQVIRDTISAASYDTLKNVGAGTYCLVVSNTIAGNQSGLICFSDSACTFVYGPEELAATGVKVNVSCQGLQDGSVELTVAGGTPPYSYLWSNGSTNEDISFLSPQTYTITVTDQNGCQDTASFNIGTEVDNTLPVILCPSDITVGAPAGLCTATVTYAAPVGTDNCAGVQTVQTGGLPSGSLFPVGVTENTFTATDSAGNIATCSFSVTVMDITPPQITCASDIAAANESGLCGATVTYSSPVASDICSAVNIIQIAGLPSGSYFPCGTTLNTFQATDSTGNNVSCSFVVTVADTSLPVLICNPDTLLTSNPGSCGAFFNYAVNASDNCSVQISQTSGLVSGSLFPVGTTLNTFTATDSSGNNVTCSFSVTVTDLQPPLVNCQTISLLLDSSGFVVLDPAMVNAGSTDNCGIASLTLSEDTLFCSDAGDNVVTLTVTDIHGNSASCTTIITVSSTLSAQVTPEPVQLCLGNNIVLSGNPSGGSGIYVSHHWSGDNGDIADTTLQQADFISSAVGVFEMEYQVTDDKGCSATDQVVVTVFPPLTSGLTVTDVACSGGTTGAISVSLSGGSGISSYLWSTGSTLNTVTGLTAGTYTLTISDAAGCVVVIDTVVQEPAALAVSVSATPVTCGGTQDGTAVVTVTGGVFPYDYLWSNSETTSGITGLSVGTYTVTVTDQNNCSITTSVTIVPLTIAVGLAVPVLSGGYNISCAGDSNGYIDLTVISGAGPFSYVWNTGATTEDLVGLPAGNYSVTITNGFCTAVSSTTLTEPTALSLITASTDITCFGIANGIASVTVTGGIPAYSYSWNTIPVKTTAEVTGLSPGTYEVAVTDGHGCLANSTLTIAQPPAVATSAVITHLKCKGDANGIINLNVAGGTPPYSFLWNTGQTTEDRTGLKAKTYIVTVTDSHGCTKKSSFQVTEPPLYLQVITNKTNVRCYGGSTGSAKVTLIGGVAPYAYQWNTIPIKTTASIGNLAAGVYQCVITDAAGCVKTVTMTINQPPQLILTTSLSNVTTNGGNDGSASVSVSGGTPGYSYSWSTVPVTTTAAVNNLTAGNYTIKVSDTKGCLKSTVVTITQPGARIKNPSIQNKEVMSVYPNPSSGIVTVGLDGFKAGKLSLKVFDILGNCIYSDNLSSVTSYSERQEYDFRRFSKGIYLLELKAGDSRHLKRLILD